MKEVTQCLGIDSKTGVGGVSGDTDETSLAWVDKCWGGEWIHMDLLYEFSYFCIYLKISIIEQQRK